MARSPQDENGLTERQRAFISEYTANGGQIEKAAKAAGYAPAGAGTRGSELLRMPKIQDGIRKACNEKMAAFAPVAIQALQELAEKADSETVRSNAAATLLDRSGYKLPERLEITDNRTAADVERDLAILLGLEGEGDVIAGEEVTPETTH